MRIKHYNLLVDASIDTLSFRKKLIKIAQGDYIFNATLKHDGTTTVSLANINSNNYVVKRYNTKNKWHFMRRIFQRSRAINCWQMSKVFIQANIQTPNRVAVIQEKIGPLKLRSWFINQLIEGDDLLAYLEHPDLTNNSRAKALIKPIQALFKNLAQNQLSHGDLKATNIIISNTSTTSLVLIDLDAAKQHRKIKSFKRAFQKDQRRFIKNWQNNKLIQDTFNDIV